MSLVWQIPTSFPTLSTTVSHVWCVPINLLTQWQSSLHSMLIDEEQQRAEQYRNVADRDSYVATHGVLRYLLSKYVQQSPRTLCFTDNQHGKPQLETGSNGLTIEFNISHTHQYSVIAISYTPVGIDVESTARDVAVLALAKRFFHLDEYRALCALPETLQHAAFIHTWTCKEAWVKAQGSGIANAFTKFVVSVDPRQPPNVITAHDASSWHYWLLPNMTQHQARLVTRATVKQIECYDVVSWLQGS